MRRLLQEEVLGLKEDTPLVYIRPGEDVDTSGYTSAYAAERYLRTNKVYLMRDSGRHSKKPLGEEAYVVALKGVPGYFDYRLFGMVIYRQAEHARRRGNAEPAH